jgi:hypothetical protein
MLVQRGIAQQGLNIVEARNLPIPLPRGRPLWRRTGRNRRQVLEDHPLFGEEERAIGPVPKSALNRSQGEVRMLPLCDPEGCQEGLEFVRTEIGGTILRAWVPQG